MLIPCRRAGSEEEVSISAARFDKSHFNLLRSNKSKFLEYIKAETQITVIMFVFWAMNVVSQTVQRGAFIFFKSLLLCFAVVVAG